MTQFLSPGIKSREQQSKIRNIRGVATSITAFVGLAEKGEIGKAKLITGYELFLRDFGSHISQAVMSRAVQGFYSEAGDSVPAYIVRTAHYTDITSAATLTATKASLTLNDTLAVPTLKVEPIGEGVHGRKFQVSSTLSSKFTTTLNNGGTLDTAAQQVTLQSIDGVVIGSVLLIDDLTTSVIVKVTGIENNTIFFDAITIGASIADGAGVTELSFDLQFYLAGEPLELYTNVSMEPENELDYVENRINGIDVDFVVTDLNSASDPGENRPVNITKEYLTGGNDGLTGLIASDFVGSSASKTGLYALDKIQIINMACIPDSQDSVTQIGLMNYCEIRKFIFGILSSPKSLDTQGIVNYVNNTLAANTSRSAMYYPQVKVFNEKSGRDIIIPGDGHIAGIYARTDNDKGVQQVGAGEDGLFQSILGFENTDTEDQGIRDILSPQRINTMANIQGIGRCIFDSQTLSKSGGIGSQINERRVFNFVEQSLDIQMKFVLFKGNTSPFRKTVDDTITSFLLVLRLDGVLEDFFVDVSDSLNNALVRAAGKLVALVGLKVPDTIRFFDMIFTRDTRAQEAALAELEG